MGCEIHKLWYYTNCYKFYFKFSREKIGQNSRFLISKNNGLKQWAEKGLSFIDQGYADA